MQDLDLIGLDADSHPSKVPGEIWATIQIIEWMQEHHGDKKAAWEPLARKAYQWAKVKNASEDLCVYLEAYDAFTNL